MKNKHDTSQKNDFSPKQVMNTPKSMTPSRNKLVYVDEGLITFANHVEDVINDCGEYVPKYLAK